MKNLYDNTYICHALDKNTWRFDSYLRQDNEIFMRLESRKKPPPIISIIGTLEYFWLKYCKSFVAFSIWTHRSTWRHTIEIHQRVQTEALAENLLLFRPPWHLTERHYRPQRMMNINEHVCICAALGHNPNQPFFIKPCWISSCIFLPVLNPLFKQPPSWGNLLLGPRPEPPRPRRPVCLCTCVSYY